MIFLNITPAFFCTMVLLILESTPCLLQAMKNQSNNDEATQLMRLVTSSNGGGDDEVNGLSCCLAKLGLADIPVKITVVEKGLAKRYINLIDDIKNFNQLNEQQKNEFMEKFLNTVLGFRDGDIIDIFSVPETNEKQWLIIPLGNRGYNDIPLDQFINANEFVDLEQMKNVLKNDSFAKALLIECLNRCDDDFGQRDQDWQDSLSILDLKGELRRVCGNELTQFQKICIALSGEEDLDYPLIGLAFVRYFLYGAIIFVAVTVIGTFALLSDTASELGSGFKKLLSLSGALAVVGTMAFIGKNVFRYWMIKKI